MKTIGTFKNFVVKSVDGEYIRDHLATEFSEWGSHLTYRFIPKNELWIEKQDTFEDDDIKPLIAAAYTEHKALENGAGEEAAYKKGVAVQKKFRKQSAHLKFPIKMKELATFGKIHVWLVNGEIVRDKLNSEFAEGGHGLVYKYIPKNEIWLDDAVTEDLLCIFVHELTEYNLMLDGAKYEKAHNVANKVEHVARESADNREKILSDQLRILKERMPK